MPSKISKIKVFSGGLTADKRGQLSFVNNFHFKGVKRFYQIENSGSSPVRAFHGHMKEAKYFYVAKGFKALEKNTTVIIFSTSTLAQSLKDDYRYPADYWEKEVWKTV